MSEVVLFQIKKDLTTGALYYDSQPMNQVELWTLIGFLEQVKTRILKDRDVFEPRG